jgi:hypothetical protein
MKQKINMIQIIYAPGMFGNLLRFILDRSLPSSHLKVVLDPFTQEKNLHQKFEWSSIFCNSHQVNFKKYPNLISQYSMLTKDHRQPDPAAKKIIITFDNDNEIFSHRCGFYRNPLMFGKNNIDNIVQLADTKFVRESFGNNEQSVMVAKELKKIEFHADNNIWSKEYKAFLQDRSHYQFNIKNLFDIELLCEEIKKISEHFVLELEIDKPYLAGLIEKIKKIAPVDTIDRCRTVYRAIKNKEDITCADLDIIEQAWIEVLLEKEYDCVLFPFGTNWFSTTKQINEFLDRYPSYLKHMNPRLPWYNNIKNPFYLTGKI